MHFVGGLNSGLKKCKVGLIYNRLETFQDQIYGLLGYYTASCGNYLPYNYHTTLCNNPEDHRSHQHRGGSLKSRFQDQCLDVTKTIDRFVIYVDRLTLYLEAFVEFILAPFYFQVTLDVVKEGCAEQQVENEERKERQPLLH